MSINLTEKAIVQIKEIIKSQDMSLDVTNVRVGIRGKSCSGPVYAFGLDEEFDPEVDNLIVQNGLKVIHGKEFASDLNDVTVDFKESEGSRGFTFVNSLRVLNKESGCCGGGGCGSSECDNG